MAGSLSWSSWLEKTRRWLEAEESEPWSLLQLKQEAGLPQLRAAALINIRCVSGWVILLFIVVEGVWVG